jgi:Zn-dependent protease
MPDELTSSFAEMPHVCPACGSEIAPRLLACPSCQRLVHADRLKRLADAADDAHRAGDLLKALESWREALGLLPPASRQHELIAERIARLNRQVEAMPSSAARVPASNDPAAAGGSPSRWSGGVVSGVIGTLALAAWKFKFLVVFLLTKAKFLLLGLTKASTFLSMFLSVGVYATAFGAPFALGLVLSIYVHEMGHVAALVRYGVHASAPLFIPGLGAVIRLRQEFTDPKQDARIGLAGPIWGTAAALFCAGMYVVTEKPLWAALAHLGALINLFNLLPVWQLDGGRAFRALSRPQRWLALAGIATAWAASEEVMLLLLLVGGSARTVMDKTNPKPDRVVLVQYLGLVAALTALAQLHVSIAR